MKKNIILIVAIISALMILCSCECSHEQCTTASCTEPSVCLKCEAVVSQALGHNWADATCVTPKTCSVCSITDGVALGHKWKDATCTDAKVCNVCSLVEGEPLGHTWQDATCTMPKTCSVCSITEGEENGHVWEEATCTKPETCSVCEKETRSPLGHSWKEATCTTAKKCSRCNTTSGSALGHSWKEATCTTAKKCSRCNTTSGSALGHSWKEATWSSPKKCSICNTTSGHSLNYNWSATYEKVKNYAIENGKYSSSEYTVILDESYASDTHITRKIRYNPSKKTLTFDLFFIGSVDRVFSVYFEEDYPSDVVTWVAVYNLGEMYTLAGIFCPSVIDGTQKSLLALDTNFSSDSIKRTLSEDAATSLAFLCAFFNKDLSKLGLTIKDFGFISFDMKLDID